MDQSNKLTPFGFKESVSDKHIDVSAHCFSVVKGPRTNKEDGEKDRYTLIMNADVFEQQLYDKPLPYFGCGLGWFSFLLGFVCPLLWYYATFLYFGSYYRRDPRERAGLDASAIAAMGFSVALLIIAEIIIF